MKKLIVGGLIICGFVAMCVAEPLMENYSTQIATSVGHGYGTYKTYISAPCQVYRLTLANPGALTQDVLVYDGTTLIMKVESDNVENLDLNFDIPINIGTDFRLKTTTHTASAYASVQYKQTVGIVKGNKVLSYTHNITSGAVQACANALVYKIIIDAVSAQTISIADGTTPKGAVYCAAQSVTQIDLFDTPVYFDAFKSSSTAQASDASNITVVYSPCDRDVSTAWDMQKQVCTSAVKGMLAFPVEVAQLRIDSQSTAETIAIQDGKETPTYIYMADDGDYRAVFDNYMLFNSSVSVGSGNGTTPSLVTLIYRKLCR